MGNCELWLLFVAEVAIDWIRECECGWASQSENPNWLGEWEVVNYCMCWDCS